MDFNDDGSICMSLPSSFCIKLAWKTDNNNNPLDLPLVFYTCK